MVLDFGTHVRPLFSKRSRACQINTRKRGAGAAIQHKFASRKVLTIAKKDRFAERKNAGAIGSLMRSRVKDHTRNMSVKTKRNYTKACAAFDTWRKQEGISNKAVSKEPLNYITQWRDALFQSGYAASTVHTCIAGVCCGLGVSMAGITRAGTSADKRKSLGKSERAEKALYRPENADIVAFQRMVGGRRAALQRLRGSDLVQDESGEWCVRFLSDKGGKNQLQRIAPDDLPKVRAYFEAKGASELLFPSIDKNLDLHGLRAEHARTEYQRYVSICGTAAGRAKMREQLWARFRDPQYGCKAWLTAQAKGNRAGMRRAERAFAAEMADGVYHLQRANREVAELRGRPTRYDRLALCCVSVFALSHWRNEVTIKHYML